MTQGASAAILRLRLAATGVSKLRASERMPSARKANGLALREVPATVEKRINFCAQRKPTSPQPKINTRLRLN